MNSSKFSRVYLALLSACMLLVCSLFTGCKEPDFEKTSVNGVWQSQFNEKYIVTENHFTYDDGGYGFGWEAEIAELTDCYIYVKKAENDYFCVAYRDLSETACSFSNAWKTGGKDKCNSLEEAKTEFTIENGYFAYYSECSKTE